LTSPDAVAAAEDQFIRWGPARPLRRRTASDLVSEAAARWPQRLAVSAPDGDLRYAALASETRALQADLRARTTAAEPVLVRAGRSWRQAVALMAILRAGRVFVPYDEGRFGPGTLAEVAGSVGVSWMLSWDGSGFRWERVTADPAPSFLRGLPGRDRPAYVMFTSGSTGRPKPVAIGHRCLANMIQWQVERSAADHTWSTLQYAAATFDVSLQETISTLASGGRLVVPGDDARADLPALGRLLRRENVTRVFMPFAVLAHLAEVTDTSSAPLGLREVMVAGEAFQATPALRSWLGREPGVVVDNQYGPTETHAATAFRLGPDPADWPDLPPIGTPLPNVGIGLIGGDGTAVPVDDLASEGELCVMGMAVGLGYGGAAQGGFGPLECFGRAGDHAYRTGDMARWDEQGGLRFIGRRDGQVKINGIRVELGEIEARLRQQPGIREAAAVTRTDGPARRVIAFVVLASAAGVSGESLRRSLSQSLPAHLVPSQVVIKDALPITGHGKVDRLRLCQEALAPGAAGDEGRVPAAAGVPGGIERHWRDAFGQLPGNDEETIYEAGGDSLSALRFLHRLKEATGVDISLRELLRDPSVAAVRRKVQDGKPA
jgi:non-ribosomal peptide synthetase component F/aryl carrier-like protein